MSTAQDQLDRVLHLGQLAVGADLALLWQPATDSRDYLLLTACGIFLDKTELSDIRKGPFTHLKRAEEVREVQVISDLQMSPDSSAFEIDEGIRSAIVVPVLLAGRSQVPLVVYFGWNVADLGGRRLDELVHIADYLGQVMAGTYLSAPAVEIGLSPSPDHKSEEATISLQFAGDAEPRTLQELSREMNLWVDHFAALAYIQGEDATMPLAAIRRGSLIVTVAATTTPIILALAAIWNAVLSSRKDRREEEIHRVETTLKYLEIQKLLGEMKAKKANKEAQRTLEQLLVFIDRFRNLGGRVLFRVPSRVLAENPELQRQLEAIATLEHTVENLSGVVDS
jgi:hypothetical protein